MTTQEEQYEKRYDEDDTDLIFVDRKDEITGDDDSESKRALMSCGHAVTPQSLTGWCRSLLDGQQYEFTCPAPVNGTNEHCGKKWPYIEIRKLALLTDEEQAHFEEMLPRLAAARYCEFKSCPGCQSFVERKDLTNLCVRCHICKAGKGHIFQFCWQCSKSWKGPAPRSDKCENEGCINPDVDKLAKAKKVKLSQVITPEGEPVECPNMRACPTCGFIIEHDGSKCKMMMCPRCHKEFCFLCLKLKDECLKSGKRYYNLCTVAERQTLIPSWVK